MRFGEYVFATLSAAAAVTAKLGTHPTRIYPSDIPASAADPCAAYQVISDVPQNTLLDGTLRYGRVQVDVYAQTYDEAQEVADAIEGALKQASGAGFDSLLDTRRDLYEDEPPRHRVSMDFSIWKEA